MGAISSKLGSDPTSLVGKLWKNQFLRSRSAAGVEGALSMWELQPGGIARSFGKRGIGAIIGSPLAALGAAWNIWDVIDTTRKQGIGAGAMRAASNTAIGFAFGFVGTTPLILGGLALGAGYTGKKFLDYTGAKYRNVKYQHLGHPIADPFGTAATMRQRSLQLLMNSQVNGRSAMGSEAMLMHIPMLRG